MVERFHRLRDTYSSKPRGISLSFVPKHQQNIQDIVERREFGDVVWFQFSGHGVCIPGTYPHGVAQKALRTAEWKNESFPDPELYIRDEFLRTELVDALAKRGVELVAVIDSCYSGSMLDLKYTFDKEQNPNEMVPAENTKSRRLLPTLEIRTEGNRPLAFFLSGCKSTQRAGESHLGGLLTNALVKYLSGNPNIQIGELYKHICAEIAGKLIRAKITEDQNPCISASYPLKMGTKFSDDLIGRGAVGGES